MGKGANLNDDIQNENQNNESNLSNNLKDKKTFTWDEIKKNNWIVINDKVYDVGKFKKKHPGGERILINHIGEDATEPFNAFHHTSSLNVVKKFMKILEIGQVKAKEENSFENTKHELMKDFKNIEALAHKMNLFKPSHTFFLLHFLHIVAFDLAAWYLMYYSGYSNWLSYFVCVAFAVTAQAQAGWSQHDYGHLSVFNSTKLNHLMHHITIGFIKGASAGWWNFRHFNHHAKPNVHKKDLDIAFGHWLVLGKILPREVGLKKKGKYSYLHQQKYFFLIVPPLLLPVVFIIQNAYYLYRKGNFMEKLWFLSFYIRFSLMYGPILGVGGTFAFYMLVRFFESFWFVFITQMNHLPMHIDHDRQLSWFRMQLLATCNVEQSLFNDWFSGHLNFQIEHHLFPTMPRHNYCVIAPYVKSLCAKYNIEYVDKTLSGAIADIYGSLKSSGELWYEAYNM